MRVLFCPLGSPGFAFPAIAVARALAALGHGVGFVTTPGFRTMLDQEGLAWLGGDASSAAHRWHDPAAVVAQVAQIEGVLRQFPAEVVVGGALNLGALLAAQRAGLPVAVLGLLGVLPPADPRQADELRRAAAAVGVAPSHGYAGDVYLRRSVPALAGPVGSDTVLVGACAWEPHTPAAVSRWLDADERPLVVVQQARSFGGPGFWRQAMGLRGVRLAGSTARMDVPAGEVPPDALIGPLVPLGALLARASVLVCSGTTTAAVGALAAGVPVVVVPEGAEQPEVAEALVDAGVAVLLDARGLTVARLQHAVDEAIADPGRRARAATLATAFAAIDGAERAGDAIVGLGAAGRARD